MRIANIEFYYILFEIYIAI